eukprot:CAMPEP_0179856624 /NCGR_PEP_ID=MMETSP0982-20121206/11262_1 /TAXON_ID=483367 /ORGANISM="non described non described, Strain CCMP 2436" /LENGTH=94 /DNA_ID=CAMNT_0021742981 /DNA_START=357 /DNA_END=641 /DNA_ORIENTATION=-
MDTRFSLTVCTGQHGSSGQQARVSARARVSASASAGAGGSWVTIWGGSVGGSAGGLKTLMGVEFDWGGTSAGLERNTTRASSTEIDEEVGGRKM